ncbi:MAG: hypothetical protein R3178_08690, partial [Rhodothermales bacterium]|nr:hypothetical protein [Rhodothermales bacterium]
MLSRFGLRAHLCGLLFVCVPPLVAGGQGVVPQLLRTDFKSGIAAVPTGPTTGDFTVLALRVEFQPDTTRFTTGDGTFGTDP